MKIMIFVMEFAGFRWLGVFMFNTHFPELYSPEESPSIAAKFHTTAIYMILYIFRLFCAVQL